MYLHYILCSKSRCTLAVFSKFIIQSLILKFSILVTLWLITIYCLDYACWLVRRGSLCSTLCDKTVIRVCNALLKDMLKKHNEMELTAEELTGLKQDILVLIRHIHVVSSYCDCRNSLLSIKGQWRHLWTLSSRVITCLENLEMSGNLTAVREMTYFTKSQGNVGNNLVREKLPKTVYCKLQVFIRSLFGVKY